MFGTTAPRGLQELHTKISIVPQEPVLFFILLQKNPRSFRGLHWQWFVGRSECCQTVESRDPICRRPRRNCFGRQCQLFRWARDSCFVWRGRFYIKTGSWQWAELQRMVIPVAKSSLHFQMNQLIFIVNSVFIFRTDHSRQICQLRRPHDCPSAQHSDGLGPRDRIGLRCLNGKMPYKLVVTLSQYLIKWIKRYWKWESQVDFLWFEAYCFTS